MARRTTIRRRKDEHLSVCLKQDVGFQRKSTWLEHVHLVHQAVPAFSMEDVDVSLQFLGRRLSAPFLIGAMTGGTDAGARVNWGLAAAAARMGVGLALGSQRAMLEDPSMSGTFRVRDAAPDVLLLGNIGLSQVTVMETSGVVDLMTRIGADGMCVHLNAAMEMFQEEGDAPMGKASANLGRLSKALGKKLIVKETGCGISRETAARLARLGVRTIDVAGAGGTSWVRVENFRRGEEGGGARLKEFEEWGIPTAASLLEVKSQRLGVIGSGGLRTGLDLAKAIALGATMGSAALPVLRAFDRGGEEEVCGWIEAATAGLRTAMVLAGCRDLKALRRASVVLSGPLLEWAGQRGLWKGTRASKK